MDTIRQYLIPSSPAQLRSILGPMNFYRRFIPSCEQSMQPLTGFLKGKPKEFKLTSEAVEAIKQLRDKLSQVSTLMYPNSISSLASVVDVSEKLVGGILNQLVKNARKPIAFSKRFAPAGMRYSTFGRELLAVYLIIMHFRRML